MKKTTIQRWLPMTLLSAFIVGCGGGGGSDTEVGENSTNSDTGTSTNTRLTSLAGDLKAADSGFGSPFKTLTLLGLDPSKYQRCGDEEYAAEQLPEDCFDKMPGYFKGPLPSPARTLEPGEDEFSFGTPTLEMLGSGISSDANPKLAMWYSLQNYTMDGGKYNLFAGTELFLFFRSDEAERYETNMTGATPAGFENLVIKLDSSETPQARAILTISINKSSTENELIEVCREEGPVEELFCTVTADQLAQLGRISDTSHEIRINTVDDIQKLDIHTEMNVTGNLRSGLAVLASKTMTGAGTTEELSDDELPINPFKSFGWEIAKEYHYARTGDWRFMTYWSGGTNGLGNYIEPGYREVRTDAPPYTVFIYIPNLNVTVFGHGGTIRDATTRGGTYEGKPPYLTLRWSRFTDVPKDEFYRFIDQIGTIETQIYYGDVSSSDILSGAIPGADQKFRWSEAKKSQIIGARPTPDFDSGGGGGSGSGTDALGGAQVDFTFQCSTPGSQPSTVPVSTGQCSVEQKNYAKIFSCNDLDNFYQSCSSLYSCAADYSTGDYKEYYEAYLSTCDYYRP